MGALLRLGFHQGLQGVLEGIVNSWLSKAGWHIVIFHSREQGLVVLIDYVPQVQKWSPLATSNWREVSISGGDSLPLSVGASIDDAEVHVEVPGCCLDEDVVGPGSQSLWPLHIFPIITPAPLLQTFPMHIELAHIKVDPKVLYFLGVDVCLDELGYTFFQVHEVRDCHSSALEEELHWAPPALLDNGMRETAPVPKCGFI